MTLNVPKWVLAVLAIVTPLLTAGLVVTLVDDDGQSRSITVQLGTPAQQRADVPDSFTVPRAAVEAQAATDVGNHDGARSEQPAGVTPAQLDAGREQQEQLAANDQLPAVTPDAAPRQAGCVSAFVRNYSSRRGVRPRLFVVHYTVSPNRAGWSDVRGITALFNRPAFAASSHYVIDSEGHCAYIVRESDKAWTQAAANPWAVSVEVINSGREGRLAAAAGLAKIGKVAAAFGKRWRVPMRKGAVSGCRVTRSGIVTHQMLGACGGGHVDISPYPLQPVISAAKRARTAGGRVSAGDRRRCRKLQWWRTHGRPRGRPEQRAVTRRRVLDRHHVKCDAHGARRA
jgi:N-acetylmuramoyl-L-alanine amidase-like protein